MVMQSKRHAVAIQEAGTIGPADLMHAVHYPRPFNADAWVFEDKLDGCRALVRKRGATLELLARNGRSIAEQFPEVMDALARLPDCVIDGVIAVPDDAGIPLGEPLRRRALIRHPRSISLAAMQEPAVLCAFDLLSLEERDLRALPLIRRKAALPMLLPTLAQLRFVSHVVASGEAVFRTAVENGHAGIVAKRADAPYKAGRQPTWRKIVDPHFQRHPAPG